MSRDLQNLMIEFYDVLLADVARIAGRADIVDGLLSQSLDVFLCDAQLAETLVGSHLLT